MEEWGLSLFFDYIYTMNEKDIRNLIDLAQSMIEKGVTPEEAKADLMAAGILDENLNYTEPYKELEAIPA